MVTISHLAKKYVDEMPFLHEALGKKLLNYGAVGNLLMPRIEKELGREVKLYAIIMALRRYCEEMARKHDSSQLAKVFQKGTALSMRAGLCDITVSKSHTLFGKLKDIYDVVNYEDGEILNIVQGNLTNTIIVTDAHRERILAMLGKEKIVHTEDDLAQVSLKFPQEFLYMPGVLYLMNRELLWHNVNIIEIVSSLTEVNFILKRKDAMNAYGALEDLLAAAKRKNGLARI